MSVYEFPHTENYDQDLGWIIREITNIDDEITDLDTRVKYLEEHGGGGGGNYDKEIADLYAKIEALTKTVNNNKTLTDAQIKTTNANVTSLTTRVTTLESKVKSLETRTTTLEADNTTNKSNINLLKSQVTAMDTDITNIDESITTINNTLDDYNKRITALENGGGGKDYDQEIKDLQDGLATLTTTVNTNKNLTDAQITGLTSDIADLTSRVTALETTVATHTTNITALQEKDEELRQNISSLTLSVGENTTKIGEVEQDVNFLKTDVMDAYAQSSEALSHADTRLEPTLYPVTSEAPTDAESMERFKGYIVPQDTNGNSIMYLKGKENESDTTYKIYKIGGTSSGGGSTDELTFNEFDSRTALSNSFENNKLYSSNGFYYICIDGELVPLTGYKFKNDSSAILNFPPISYWATGTISSSTQKNVNDYEILFKGLYGNVYMFIDLQNDKSCGLRIGNSFIREATNTNYSTLGYLKLLYNLTVNGELQAHIITSTTTIPTDPYTFQLYKFSDDGKIWFNDGTNWNYFTYTQGTPSTEVANSTPTIQPTYTQEELDAMVDIPKVNTDDPNLS